MKAVYFDSGIPEKEAKKRYFFPENVMMENAAAALEKAVCDANADSVLILCGTGNNGGDGYALARRLAGKYSVKVWTTSVPKTDEALTQRKMCEATGVEIFSSAEVDRCIAGLSEHGAIVDCIYGTGFHGELPEIVKTLIEACNRAGVCRIACDIPTGIDRYGIAATKDSDGKPLAFCADKTVTMGALKTALFSDTAKDFCGEIVTADLGISSAKFEECAAPDAFLLEESDINLPVRTKKSVHKGNFGHAAVVLGEKPGAGIIAGTAALACGSGLVSVVETGLSSRQFFMSPELMCGKDFPANTTAVLLGSGLGREEELSDELRHCEGEARGNLLSVIEKTVSFVENMPSPAVVLDADIFYYKDLKSLLKKLNEKQNVRGILTPHPKELCQLATVLLEKAFTVSEVVQHRMEIGKQVSEKIPNLLLIAKGADTYIFYGGKTFICAEGTNALAKGGSGDVLAGLCAGLLAQGYSAEEAAETAVFMQGKASQRFQENYACTPLSLIEKLGV